MCVITANGIIQMANKNLLKLFGYKKSEVEGKNISMLMPAPFSQRHNTYLRNYLTTGAPRLLLLPLYLLFSAVAAACGTTAPPTCRCCCGC